MNACDEFLSQDIPWESNWNIVFHQTTQGSATDALRLKFTCILIQGWNGNGDDADDADDVKEKRIRG